MRVSPAELDELNDEVRSYNGLRERVLLLETAYRLDSLLRYINYQHLAIKAYLDFKEKEIAELKLRYATPESRTFTDPDLGTETFTLEETLVGYTDDLSSDKEYFQEHLYESLFCLVLESLEKTVYQLCEFSAELKGDVTIFSQFGDQVVRVQNYRLYLDKNAENSAEISTDHQEKLAAYTAYKSSFFDYLDLSLNEYIGFNFGLIQDNLKESNYKLDHTLVLNAYETACHLIETIEDAFEKKFYPIS